MIIRKIKKLSVFLFLCILGACGSTVVENCNKRQAEVFLELVSFNSLSNANNNTAVALDLVILYDESLIKTFLDMSASSYFSKKQQLILDYPVQMQVKSWEVVPGQQLTPYSVTFSHPLPQAAFFYANYSSSGEHRQRLGDQKGVQVVLGKTDISLRELSTSEIQALLSATPSTSHSGLDPVSQSNSCGNCCCCCNSSNSKASIPSTATKTSSPSSASTSSISPQEVSNRATAAQSAIKDLQKLQSSNRAAAAQNVLKDLQKIQSSNRAIAAQDVLKDLSNI